MLAVLAGESGAWRAGSAPLAGNSTLNRLELSREAPRRTIIGSATIRAAIEALFVDLFLDAHRTAPAQITIDSHILFA